VWVAFFYQHQQNVVHSFALVISCLQLLSLYIVYRNMGDGACGAIKHRKRTGAMGLFSRGVCLPSMEWLK
jgi:hypothetical protein